MRKKTIVLTAMAVTVMYAATLALAGCNTAKQNPPETHSHTLEFIAEEKATCTEAGHEAYYKCTDPECGKLFSDKNGETEIAAAKSIPATGHNMTKHEAVEASCGKEGNLEYYTCANEAADVYYADEAGTTTLPSVITEKTGEHTLVKVPEIAATCAAEGTEAYWTCVTCNAMFSDEKGETEITAPVSIPKSNEHGAPKFAGDGDEIPDPVAGGGDLSMVCSVCGETLESISYAAGFKNTGEQVTTQIELPKEGKYYATTWKSDNGKGGWNYKEILYIAFEITEAGTYTLQFEDLIVQKDRVRVLNNLAIKNTGYVTFPSPTDFGIFEGAELIPGTLDTQLQLVGNVTMDAWQAGTKEQFYSITFTTTAENLTAQGGALYIQVGVCYYAPDTEGALKVQSNCVVPVLITLSKKAA